MRRDRRLFCSLGLPAVASFVLGCPGEPPVAPVAGLDQPLPDDSPAKPFVGSYKFVGGDPERVAVQRAIDDCVAGMNGLIRGIARGRLQDANRVPDALTLKGGANVFAVYVDERPYAGPLDGSSVKVTTVTGDVMDLSYKLGPELEQIFQDQEKGRINRFELRDNILVMHVRVHATQLPKELLYDLTFERI